MMLNHMHVSQLNTLGQYRLTEVISRGGMATIYKAYQPALDRYVAIKILSCPQDRHFSARFRREAWAIAQLQHPNILPIYDYGEQEDLIYLVLQYVESGRTLSNRPPAPMPVSAALRLTHRLLDALSYAHQHGIIHRDIKPENILLPTPHWPLLADFGIAKPLDDRQRLTAAGLVIGTPAYMAPEQALGEPIDARTDLYATGAVLYELLTGNLPFDADTPTAMLVSQAFQAPAPPRAFNLDIPEAVEAIVLRALAKDPAARYQSAAEMAKAIGSVAAKLGRPATAPPQPAAEQRVGNQAAGLDAARKSDQCARPVERSGYKQQLPARPQTPVTAAPAQARPAWQAAPRSRSPLVWSLARIGVFSLALILLVVITIAVNLDSAPSTSPERIAAGELGAAPQTTIVQPAPVRLFTLAAP